MKLKFFGVFRLFKIRKKEKKIMDFRTMSTTDKTALKDMVTGIRKSLYNTDGTTKTNVATALRSGVRVDFGKNREERFKFEIKVVA
jgi:hypothetical protein